MTASNGPASRILVLVCADCSALFDYDRPRLGGHLPIYCAYCAYDRNTARRRIGEGKVGCLRPSKPCASEGCTNKVATPARGPMPRYCPECWRGRSHEKQRRHRERRLARAVECAKP